MPRTSTEKGFGLIEIMVGLAIGMIATIVMFQTFAVSERQKRTTTGAADAQSNGAIATFVMERDIKMAGWGIDSRLLGNCDPLYTWHESKNGPIDNFGTPGASLMASVTIADGGNAPDAITIQYYGNPANANATLGKTSINGNMPMVSSEYEVDSIYGCEPKLGEPPPLAIISQKGKGCTLAQITQAQSPPGKLQHNKGVDAPYNPDASNMGGWPPYTKETDPSKRAYVQCFSSLYRRTYQIAAQKLTLTQPDNAGVDTTFEVAPEILHLQAQYGIADAGSQQINAWVAPTGNWATASLTATNVKRIKAVRIALLARSAAYEKPEDGVTCTATTAANVASWPAWAGFTTTQLPADWQCYRYKAFEMTIPLRNIIWAKI
jgi:type IV pilus assembly protein PilW